MSFARRRPFWVLPLICALGQNTGLKVGEERRSVEEGPSPLGGAPMRSNQVLKLVVTDGGKARYAWTDAYDPESLRNLIAEGARQIAQKEGRNGEDAAARRQALLKSIKITRDEHTDIDIENGTIRRIQSEKNTVAEGLGITYLKRETKTVTVTRLP
jgi:hypothetical protein